VSEGGSRLVCSPPLRAVIWNDAVRRNESDPWAYLRRNSRRPPRHARFQERDFREREVAAFADPGSRMPPGALEAHKEAFEALLPIGEYADLSFHLDRAPTASPAREGGRVLSGRRADFVRLRIGPPNGARRLEKRVAPCRASGLDRLTKIAERGG